MTASALFWLERLLLTGGMVFTVWGGMTRLEGDYYAKLPVPRAAAARPGETGNHASAHPGRRALERGAWVARLEAPRIGLSATILEGSDDATLRRAAGHIEDTALPGEPGNVGIAGHRDTTFRAVRHVKTGDTFRLTTADRTYVYRVVSTAIVEPRDVHVLDPTPEPSLTLVTCYPFTFVGNAPQRYIVKADLLEEHARY